MLSVGFIKTYVMEAGPEISYALLLGQLVKEGLRPFVIELNLDRGVLDVVDCSSGRLTQSHPLRLKWEPAYAQRLAGCISSILADLDIRTVDLLYNRKSALLYRDLIDLPCGRFFFLRFYHSVLTGEYRSQQTLNTEKERALFRELVGRVSRCTAISEYIRRNAEAVAGPAMRDKTVVIPDGIVLPGTRRGQTGERYAGRPYIVYAGRIETFKGIDLLLFAFFDFARKFPGVDLRIIGEGRLRKNMEKLARDLGLGDRVVFTGWLDHAATQRWIRDALFLVLPSRVEPFGRPLIEAMAWGRAVVATNVGGMPEIIRDGRNGILVSPDPAELGRAMCRLGGDAGLRRRIGSVNREDARAYDIRATAKAHIDLYEKTIADHRD